MIHRLFSRSIPGTIMAALILMTASLAFAQVSTEITKSAPADKLTAVNTENLTDGSTVTAEPSTDKNLLKTDKSTAATSLPEPTANRRSSGSKWEFAFAPYLYMTGLSGTVGARGNTSQIDLSFGDVLKHFKFGIMGTFEARKDRLLIVNDIVWVKMSEERSTPGGLYSTAKVGVNMFTWSPEFGYRLYESKAGSIDVLGGIRLTSVENTLKFTTGILPGFDVNARKTWAAPIIGAHGLANLSPKVYLSGLFDVGGGFGTHFTGQFYGGMGYRITPKIALIGGYRYLNNNFHDSEGFVYNTHMNGIVVGAKFNF